MPFIPRTTSSRQSKRITKKKETSKQIKLHDYQEKSLKFVLAKKHAGLFLAPGLGKTIIALKAFEKLRAQGKVDKLIVIAKLRIVHTVWPKEIKKWGFDFKVNILHGGKKEQNFADDADVYLINNEGLPWLHSKLKSIPQRRRFDQSTMLVVDESTAFKNTKSQRFRRLKPLLKLFYKRVIMTGSPAPNGLVQLYGQIYILDMGASLGETKSSFLVEYFYPSGYMGYQWLLQEGARERIYNALKNVVIRFGKDELDLPPLIHNPVTVELPSRARKIYKDLETDFIAEVENGIVTAANAGVATGKLRQVASGYLWVETSPSQEPYEPHTSPPKPHSRRGTDGVDKKSLIRVAETVHEAKLEALLGLVAELQGSPCLVAYQYNHELAALKEALPDTPHIGGGVSTKEGIRIEDEWNKGNLPVLLGQIDSIAHGLNLQESGTDLVIFTMTWDLEIYEQVIQRLWRQGQKNAVTVHHLIAEDTIDEIMLDIIDLKDLEQSMLLEALEYKYDIKIGGLLDMSKTMEALLDAAQSGGYSIPEYGVNAAGEKQGNPTHFYVLGLLAMLSRWSHSQHQRFIREVTGKEENGQELVALYGQSRTLVFNAFHITEDTKGGFNAPSDSVKLFKKFSKMKLSGVIVDPTKEEEYLNMESKFAKGGKGSKSTTTTKEKTMSTTKKKATPKKTAKKAPVKKTVKKKAVTKKSTAKKAPVEKTVKKTAKKASPTPRKSALDESTKISQGSADAKGVHAKIQELLPKQPTPLSKVLTMLNKNLDHKNSGDNDKLINYIKFGIRTGSVNTH